MELVDGHTKALLELLEIFGLQHKSVTSLTLNATANDLLVLKAEFYVYEKELEGLTEILRKYELVERGNDAH